MPSPTDHKTEISTLIETTDIEKLKQQLPHVDFETGLKHRTVKRDPITGLGTLTDEQIDKSHQRTSSLGRKGLNQTLIAWDADSIPTETNTPIHKKAQRNPITLTGDLGNEVDRLRTTNGKRSGIPREPQRDPISGRGNFGSREWDPIGKYNGKTRRAKSSTGVRSNPLTGENVKTFTVMVEEKASGENATPKQTAFKKNIFTGENCENFTVSPELKSPTKKIQREPTRNAITGENCSSYDFNSEVRQSKKRTSAKSSNPLNGENVSAFMVSHEEKPRTVKPYLYKNTVTGENLQSYKITPIERNISPRVLKERQNPLSGENVQTYTYRVGESKKTIKKRDISSPLTGEGSRGRSYTVSIEEKNLSQPNLVTNLQESRHRSQSSRSLRNILTGENCETYNVCVEMRSEKLNGTHIANGGIPRKAAYNIITGE